MQPAELLRRYPLKPANRHLFIQQRKYFDSGDYALSKAGKGGDEVGSQHPVPEDIPHPTVSAPTASPDGSPAVQTPLPKLTLPAAGRHVSAIFPGNRGIASPVRGSSFLHHETTIDDEEPSKTPIDAEPTSELAVDPETEDGPLASPPRSGSLPYRS